MRLVLDPVKDKMIMCRFAPGTFKVIQKLAKQNKTSHGKVVGALVEKALNQEK
jgi:hypothetical protein